MSIASIPNLGAMEAVRGRRSPGRALAAVAVALVLAALAQTSVASVLPSTWPRPDLVLVVAVAWGYLRGGGEGFLAAVLGGALLDLSSSGPFGLHVLAFGLASLAVANSHGPFAGSVLRRAIGAAAAAGLAHLVLMVVMQLRGWDVWWTATLFRTLLPALAADAALVPLAYVLLRRLPEPAPDTVGGEASGNRWA
jgi:rod shape-determining protein MreD